MKLYAMALAAVFASGAAFAAPAQPIPNQYIVTLNKAPAGDLLYGLGVTPTASRLLATVGGGQVLFTYEHALRGFAVRLSPLAAQMLARNPLVARVEQDSVVHAVAVQSNPPSYGLDRVDQRNRPLDAKYTWPDQGGLGVHVYVLDTGLNVNHQDFTGRVGAGRNFAPHGGVLGVGGSTDPADISDCHGHGTHVSGTSAGTSFGIAKRATVHPVRVLDCQGSGSNAAVIGGIDWVAANAIKPAIANMSLGGGNNDSLDQAVRNAVATGVTFAVAAGNDSANACTGSPNRVAEAITVGASDANDAQASYSNFGTCVDLYAPGSNIVSANYASNTGSATMSGTSMASPHVAGAGALVLGRTPSASPAAVWSTLNAESTAGVLTGLGTGSPNKLLYVANAGGTPANQPPVASFTFTCNALSCSFDGTGSTDDNGIASYAWTFGDGGAASGSTATHAYAAAGTYSATLTVTDGGNLAGTQTRSVTVTSGSGGAPCTACTKYSGSLASGAQTYHPNSNGFAFGGGTLKGYLRGPAGADFDLYLEKKSTGLLGGTSWTIVARGETTTASEDLAYAAASGTYRWRVKSYSGAGAYDFWGEPQ